MHDFLGDWVGDAHFKLVSIESAQDKVFGSASRVVSAHAVHVQLRHTVSARVCRLHDFFDSFPKRICGLLFIRNTRPVVSKGQVEQETHLNNKIVQNQVTASGHLCELIAYKNSIISNFVVFYFFIKKMNEEKSKTEKRKKKRN